MTRFHLELAAQGQNMTAEQFDGCFEAIADAFYECAGIENQDVEGDSSTQILAFSMDIESDDEIEAFTTGFGAARTALHMAGGATPGWEEHFAMVKQTMRSEAEYSSERDLEDAAH